MKKLILHIALVAVVAVVALSSNVTGAFAGANRWSVSGSVACKVAGSNAYCFVLNEVNAKNVIVSQRNAAIGAGVGSVQPANAWVTEVKMPTLTSRGSFKQKNVVFSWGSR